MNIERVARRLFQMAGIICLGTITVLSLLPGDDRPHVFSSGNIEHTIAYIGTAFFASSLPGLGGWRIVLFLSAVSVVFEGLQMFIPGRTPGLGNWLASTGGAVIGLALNWLFAFVLRSRLFTASR